MWPVFENFTDEFNVQLNQKRLWIARAQCFTRPFFLAVFFRFTRDRLSERGAIVVVYNQSHTHDEVREMHELLNTYVHLSFSSMFVLSLFSSFQFCRHLEPQLPGDLRRYQYPSVEIKITWQAIWLVELLSVLTIRMKPWDSSILFYFHNSVCIKGSWNNWLQLTISLLQLEWFLFKKRTLKPHSLLKVGRPS